MKKTEFERRPYVRPEIEVIKTDEEYILISTSIDLDAPGSTEEDWGNEDLDAGEIEL